MNKICFVIPTYQHSQPLKGVLNSLASFNTKTFVIDDGSDVEHRERLDELCRQYDFVEMIRHPQNRGKGEACRTGLTAAFEAGFTHGVQIDSDGQHDLSKVPELLQLSARNPGDLISGQPRYDGSVPRARLYGRYATHIWVWIETLSFQLKDSMCGFRVYPLQSTVGELDRVGRGMDFDTEIMVRLFWSGVRSHFVPVPVKYPEGGVSHFHVWRDNVRITKMHTRLFFGMLWRLPKLLWRRQTQTAAWHAIGENGSYLGLKTLQWIFNIFGPRFLKLALIPVAAYYSLNPRVRSASRDYRDRLRRYGSQKASFSTFRHVYAFASMAVDKFAVWIDKIKYADLVEEGVNDLLVVKNSGQGAFFISSHYGNIEVCRALGRYAKARSNALVYYENARRFTGFLSRLNPDVESGLISVGNFGPDLAISLKEKLEKNEWVFIMGDRLSVRDDSRALRVKLLGEEVLLPEGPFIMAYIMEVPVYVIHCFREGKQFRLKLKPIVSNIERGRARRREIIQDMAEQYARELESVVLHDPIQWFNFFPFWRTDRA